VFDDSANDCVDKCAHECVNECAECAVLMNIDVCVDDCEVW
jgi:hypothetical protein